MAQDVTVLPKTSEGPYQPVKWPAGGLVARSELALQLISDLWGVLKTNPTFEIQKALGSKLEETALQQISMRPHRFEVFDAIYDEQSEETLVVTGPDGEKSNLRDIITNLNKCQFLDQNCKNAVQSLSDEEKELMNQITMLELKHEQGYVKFKKTQEMWADMEQSYQDKLKASAVRQQAILDQINAINESIEKYRFTLKMSEEHLNSLNKLHEDKIEDMKIAEDEYNVHYEEIKKLEEKKAEIIIQKAETEANIISVQTEVDYQQQIHKSQMEALNEQLQRAVTNRDNNIAEIEDELSAARNAQASAARQLLKEQLRAEQLETEVNEVEASINILSSATEKNDKKFKEKIDKIAAEDAKINAHLTKLWSQNTKTDVDSSCTDMIHYLSHKNICSDIKQKFLIGIYDSMKPIIKGTVSQHLIIKKLNQMLMKDIMTSEDISIDNNTKETLKEILIDILKKNYEKFVSCGIAKTIFEPKVQYQNNGVYTSEVSPSSPTLTDNENENEDSTLQLKQSYNNIDEPDFVINQDDFSSQAANITSRGINPRTYSPDSSRRALVKVNFADGSYTKSKGAAHRLTMPLSMRNPGRSLSPPILAKHSPIGAAFPFPKGRPNLIGRSTRKAITSTDRQCTTYGVKGATVIHVDSDRYAKSKNYSNKTFTPVTSVPIKRRELEPRSAFKFGKVFPIRR